ncbi:hypothetical protein CYMTET_23967 [Cymbomonas tetramitiformis]|uniref:Uncharacterized protein n=1 Tax=Cymbomonas tetramitiformis TaxID=36881 RepID=A0AAE0FWU4_9CHLO|nr:hypothetical protein CYMTET_23967 [Cymbomonas tetramitiformis]
MYEDKSYDSLSKKTASSMKYDCVRALTVRGRAKQTPNPCAQSSNSSRIVSTIQGTEGLVTDSLLKEYLDEFDKGKNKAAMYANMKHAALVETGNTRGGGRGAGAGWRDEKKEQSPAGGKGKGKDRGNPTGNTGADA